VGVTYPGCPGAGALRLAPARGLGAVHSWRERCAVSVRRLQGASVARVPSGCGYGGGRDQPL